MQHMDGTHRTVLICDDDSLVRQLAAGVLENQGYECLVAASQLEALSLFTNHAVDVVLMDIYLGDGNGIDCVRKIRSMPAGDETPVIFITGSLEPMDVEACLDDKIGASAYLHKPLVWETLPALCNALVVSTKIRSELLAAAPEVQDRGSLLEGLHHVGEMLGQVIASEEARSRYTQSSPNLGVLAQLNVAVQALKDVEGGLRQLLSTEHDH